MTTVRTIADHEAELEALTLRMQALDLLDAEGRIDPAKLVSCADLSGSTADEKMTAFEELTANRNRVKAERDSAIEQERRYRAAAQQLQVIESSPADLADTGRRAYGSVRELVADSLQGKDLTQDICRGTVPFGQVGGLRTLIAALFNVSPDSTPPMDERFRLFTTRVGRAAMLLMLLTEEVVPEGQSAIYGGDMVEGGAAANRDGRSGSDAPVAEASNTAAARQFVIQEISVGQAIDRVRARDHGGFVDAMVGMMQNQTIRQLWAQVIAGSASGANLHGGNTQITNTSAVVGTDKILSYFETEIDELQKNGCEPNAILFGSSERMKLPNLIPQPAYSVARRPIGHHYGCSGNQRAIPTVKHGVHWRLELCAPGHSR